MIDVQTTERFDNWLSTLRDRSAAANVAARIRRIQLGLLGDAKVIGSGVSELRINFGPGYRVYFTHRGRATILLLCGGDKSTQSTDIKIARSMASLIQHSITTTPTFTPRK